MSLIDLERNNTLYNTEKYMANTNMWKDKTGEPRAKAFFKIIKKSGLVNQIESVLDIGCGSGGVLRYLAKNKKFQNCKFYYGVDISSNAIKIANELFDDAENFNVKFESIDVSSELRLSNKFTIVSMLHVIEHVPDIVNFVKTYGKLGTFIYINVPIEFTLNYALRKDILKSLYSKYGHLHFFDESFIDNLLESNGYKIIGKVYSNDYEGRNVGVSMNIINIFRLVICKLFGPSFSNYLLSGFSYGILIKKNNREF